MRRPRLTATVIDGLKRVRSDAATTLEEREGWKEYSADDDNENKALEYLQRLIAWYEHEDPSKSD